MESLTSECSPVAGAIVGCGVGGSRFEWFPRNCYYLFIGSIGALVSLVDGDGADCGGKWLLAATRLCSW